MDNHKIYKLAEFFYKSAGDVNGAPRQAIVTAISKFKNHLSNEFNNYLTGDDLSDQEYEAVTTASNVVIHTPFVAKKVGDKYRVSVNINVTSDPVVAYEAFQKISNHLVKKLSANISNSASVAANQFASSETTDFNASILPMVTLS